MGTMFMDNILLKDAKTPTCKTKSGAVIYLLHEALAMEIICVLRYKRYYFTARGTNPESVEQSLRNSIGDDLVAQRIAIDSCREMIRRTDDDPANRRTLNDILANEEECAEDLTSLLKEFYPDPIPVSSTDQTLSCPTH